MIKYKNIEEINLMQDGGKKLKNIADKLVEFVKPGIRTFEIDKLAEKLILEEGGAPSFKEVKGYFWSTCLPINEQVVHTPPSKRALKEGDILTIDIGIKYQGFHTDYATTLVVGKAKDKDINKFLEIGRETLNKAIEKAKAGRYLGEISETIENNIQKSGNFVLKELTGHGIGRDLHEEPYVLGYLNSPIDRTLKIKPGLVIAIEIIYSTGTEKIAHEKGENWSIATRDKSLSACFEKTVAVLPSKTIILT